MVLKFGGIFVGMLKNIIVKEYLGQVQLIYEPLKV